MGTPMMMAPKRETTTGGGDCNSIELRHKHQHELDHEDDPAVKNLFEKTVNSKKNIYSTEPIPLNNPWTFWVDRTERGVNLEQYDANLRRIYTVYTVQRFWAVYYNIPKPADLHVRSSLHMMRDDRKPVWEEEYNCKGGTFRLRVHKKDSNKVWKELLMAAIGEQLNEFVHEKDEICGVSISTREKEDCVLIWNTSAELAKESRILECLRLILPDTTFVSTFYKPHVTHHAFEKANGQANHKKGPNSHGRGFKLHGPERAFVTSGVDH